MQHMSVYLSADASTAYICYGSLAKERKEDKYNKDECKFRNIKEMKKNTAEKKEKFILRS